MNVDQLCFGHRRILCVYFLLFHTFFRVHAQRNSELGKTEHYRLGPDLSPPMMVLAVVLLVILFIMVFFSIYLRRYVDSRAAMDAVRLAERRFRSCHGVDLALIQRLPVIVHSADLEIGKKSPECAVCLSEFRDCETLRLLPNCDHVFHPNCVDAWLASRPTCPICRAKLTSDGDEKSTADSEQRYTSEENSAAEIDVNEADRKGDSSITSEGTVKITGKFQRSYSTGHSLVEDEEDTEMYTLRLAKEQRKERVRSGKLKRSASYDTVLYILESN